MGSAGLKSRCWSATFLLEALGGGSIYLFQLLDVAHLSWLMVPFYLQSQESLLNLSEGPSL